MDPPAWWSGVVVDYSTVPGFDPVQPLSIYSTSNYRRMLVSVTGSSISWFGVVVPLDNSSNVIVGYPHVFFTPFPSLGGYFDDGYSDFSTWIPLWNDYTTLIGSQVSASGKSQILIIPFYANSQTNDLGSFLLNWQDVFSAVIGTAINSVSPNFIPTVYQFDSLTLSSFSSGIQPLQNFVTGGSNVSSMMTSAFALDPPMNMPWRPPGCILYTTAPPPGSNPIGSNWYLGGRFGPLINYYTAWNDCAQGGGFWCDHALTRLVLLHGLMNYC